MPRHSPYALFRLNSRSLFSLSLSRLGIFSFFCLSFANNCYSLGCKLKRPLIHTCFFLSVIDNLLSTPDEIVTLDFVRKNLLKFLLTSFSLYTTICSFLSSLFGFQWACHFLWKESNQRNFTLIFIINVNSELCSVVGPSGLEPPTSCLSGTRSNLLSYEPLWLVKWFLPHLVVEMMGFEPMTPCLQGRCSPSWATPPF